jgi:hypothetical protein
MKYIKTIIIKIFLNESPKPIGRWKIESSNYKINTKIDLSNEDHCGSCRQYALTKIDNDKPQNIIIHNYPNHK